MEKKYKNKVIVITGAANGIGRALAMAYAKEGAVIAAIDNDKKALQQSLALIKHTGGMAATYLTDLKDAVEIKKSFQKIFSEHGRIDGLINNAGIMIRKSLDVMTVEEWDEVINTNLRPVFLCSKEVFPAMKNAGTGFIINIASTRATMSESETFPYSASKGGIVALTHSLAISLGEYGIRVNSVSPGWIHTGDEKLRKKDHKQHPAGRVGNVADVVKSCFYLSDPENDFVIGENLVVDGGMTRKMIYEK